MTSTEAQALGTAAFHNGIGNFPLAIPAIAAEMENAKVGEKTHLLKAFNKGWSAANLAA
ncbi:hypothetical protein [Mycolicibacterium austroafricanum]|uniref:hypothetical protein n=1 Tax=Mycolicibacterium austroafricanum TaxID=39687 RepID=UPI001AC00923|nr:hypothetical protein [Mycolicibacterium austroafricanum]QRZ05870.1 hypothetical protein JN090_23565 [Mycolicibacterium austroafricanum]